MANPELSMNARTGSDNQRYGPSGERLVAGMVALSNDKTQVLLVQASSTKGYVIPKGGWELDETAVSTAARREAWEEAGITCKEVKSLGTIADSRSTSKGVAKAHYYFFESVVDKEHAAWPEQFKRSRRWFCYTDAVVQLAQRPELLAALNKSSIQKN